MEQSICQNATTGDMFFIEHMDSVGVLINSGLHRSIVDINAFKLRFEDISDELVPHFFRHVMSMKKSGSSNQETLNLFNTIAYHTLELTKRAMTPFELMDQDEQGSGKQIPTELKNALGYWDRALIYLDVDVDETTGEETTIIRVILNGYLFISRLANVLDVSEEELADTENISEHVDILPRFIAAESNDYEDEQEEVSRIDFDVAIRPDPDFADELMAVSEEQDDG